MTLPDLAAALFTTTPTARQFLASPGTATMPRAKRKATPQPIGDHVDQIRAGEGFTDARVVMMPGETQRVALNTRRRACPALRWGWLSKQQQAAIVLYEDARDSAGLDTVRSALCPPTGGDGARPERLAIRRKRYETLCDAIRNKLALEMVSQALANRDRETIDQIAERWFGGRRTHNREAFEVWSASVADDVLAWVAAGERVPVRAAPVTYAADAFEAWAEGLV